MFFNLPADFMTSTLGYARGLITDFTPLLTLIVGLFIAGVVLSLIIDALRK